MSKMHRNLHSPTKLTEFARDFEEEPDTFLTKFVNKFTNVYNASYNTVNEAPSSSSTIPKSISQNNFNSNSAPLSRSSSTSSLNSNQQTNLGGSVEQSSSSTNEAVSESTEKPDQINLGARDGRSMRNVLKHISNIGAGRNNNLRNYKDTELQRFWMPDSKAKECYECAAKFSTFRRKHHCRLCGQIFCSKCCNQLIPGKIIMCSGELKVCNYCSKIPALQEELDGALLDEDFNDNPTETATKASRKVSVGYQEERLVSSQTTNLSNADRRNILQQSNSLKALHEEMVGVLPYQNCGTKLISYLITNQKSSNKIQAIAILNAMLEAGFLIPIVPDTYHDQFDENLHYRLVPKNDSNAHSENFQLDLNLESNAVHLSRSKDEEGSLFEDLSLPKSLDGSLSFQSVKDIEMQNSIRSTTTTAKEFLKSYCDHEELLLNQLLRNENLEESWAKILIPLCARAANQFRPELFTNELMDIRNYVKFKKIPGGQRCESAVVGGIVFSKNVAHKEMATRIDRPKILLLECPIVYERVEGKFVCIETLLLAEKEYLRNVTARILSLKPNVVLVHKNVAGIAQDMLRSQGITLVLDVKMVVLERLARCLQCDIVTKIESNIEKPKLGTCDSFYVKTFDVGSGVKKTLMFFEMLSNVKAACCLIRGGINAELAHVKKVAALLIFARFNWRLEMSFLLDEFARPPTPKPLIFDSKEHTPSEEESNTDNERKSPSREPESVNKSSDGNNSEQSPRSKVNEAQKKLLERKSEEKIVTIKNVNDFSDPLRAPELSPTKSDPEESSVEFAVHTPYDNRFRTSLSSTVLSVSPFLTFPLPYLETEQGRKCPLRHHFPNVLYYSKQWCENTERTLQPDVAYFQESDDDELSLLPPHPFILLKMTKPVEDIEIQTLLAEFRAYGGRAHMKMSATKPSVKKETYQAPQKVPDNFVYKDALDIENHQRLPVLFYSYYYNPKAASSFCMYPVLLDMKFYGQQDIMLGQFLERYCFKQSYICPSCNLPIMDHVRRYVHSLGCVEVSLIEESNKNEGDQIYLASWCSLCSIMTPSIPISQDTYGLSFAKYLELRFHGHVYKKRVVDVSDNGHEIVRQDANNDKCKHSLHRDHIHYFSSQGIVVKFAYYPISVYEISIPPLILHLKKPKPFDNAQVLEDIKHFAVRGYEIYSKICDQIAEMATDDESPILTSLKQIFNRDQFIFRQHVEIVQTLLTEKNVNSYDLSDAMMMAKRALADSIELWGPRLHKAAVQSKNLQKQDSNATIDSGTICTEDLESPSVESKSLDSSDETPRSSVSRDSEPPTSAGGGPNQPQTSGKTKENSSKSGQENISDKKTIKQLLMQLLPSASQTNTLPSPFSANEHRTLPLGAFPVLVNDQDLSSLIAYSLVSNSYNKAFESSGPNSGYVSDVASSPNVKRKSQDGVLESEEKENGKAEEDKKTKPSSHIDLSFSDATVRFVCRVYFAKEFDAMRANVLKPPKLEKSIYKELEMSKQLEERKMNPRNSSPDPQLIRKPSSTNMKSTENKKDTPANESEFDDSRIFFARSLCKSIPWEARGGKSGSKFRKTSDDRFVLKEMSKMEVGIFENFAPNYFEYINKCLEMNQPTLLAKILGIYRVQVTKKDSSLHEKYLLVMENLFYDCTVDKKFDLKGSERNRLVETNYESGENVLLDENLLQMAWAKPLYILSHSKTILREAISRDSSFLERNKVMDYSLLVGSNNKDNVLVLGLIDYIRTFTLDKRLEYLVKQAGILGGKGCLPTITPPEKYKERFIEAMDRYFFSVPDRWEGLSKK